MCGVRRWRTVRANPVFEKETASMKRIALLAIAALALPLSGCATPITQAISTIGTVETVVNYAQSTWAKAGVGLFDVEATYGVIQTAMVNFEKAECPRASTHSFCPKLQSDFAVADASVRVAFGKGEAFIAANPTLSPSAVIQAAESAINSAASLADSYGVKL